MSRNRPRYTDAERDQVRKLWSGGRPPSRGVLDFAAAEMGRSVGSIRSMASYLGVSSDGRKPKTAARAPRRERACLRCNQVFRSEGSHERICEQCKCSADWKSGGGYSIGVSP